MPPKGASTAINPIRLQTVQKLRLKRPNEEAKTNPCMGPMSTVLNCWASASSQAAAGGTSALINCAALEQALRECMDFNKQTGQKKNDFNYHLSRLYPKIRGPRRKKGSIG